MKSWLDRFKFQGLFLKMFLVMVISITAVAVSVLWATVRMSEQLFMETFSITNSKVIQQIKNNFESFHDSIVTAAGSAQESGSIKSFLTEKESPESLRVMKSYYNMTEQMKKIQSTVDAYAVGVTLIGRNGRSYSSTFNPLSPIYGELARHEITANAAAQPRKLMYQLYLEEDDVDKAVSQPVLVATKVLREQKSGDLYGTLYISLLESSFKPFYSSFTSSGNDVAILDSRGKIMSSNRSELIGRPAGEMLEYAKEIESQGLDYLNKEVMGKNSIVLAEYLPSYDFYIVNMIDKKLALGQMVDTKTVILICTAIVLIALVIVFLISRKLTRSLTLLVRQMSKITERNFHNYITVTGGHEIRELGKAFNYMLDEVNDYVERLVETQKGQRNAELAALQRQINPHFLYNTLASVKFLVQQGSKDKAVETIHALISLLQNSISGVSETITVEQELVNLKHYVFINHVRYGERIRVNYFITPDCLSCHLPKLIIQPFIENAFFHAFHSKAEGTIHVMVSREQGSLICEVADNGDGMDEGADGDTLPGPTSNRQLFTGIGITNVHERIRLLYGEEYGITIASRKGEGTRVKIRLPLIES